MKSALYLIGTISISLGASALNAQTPTPDAGSLGQFDRSPIQQPGVLTNPNSGSRQFFQQGRDNLYFLEEAEPILQIDGEVDDEIKPEQEVNNVENQKLEETPSAE